MADESDTASDISQHALDVSLKNQLAKAHAQDHAEYNAGGQRICIDCEVVIPDSRIRLVNAVRCVTCQDVHERQARGYRHDGGGVWQ